MKINDQYSLKRDKYNFILVEHSYGTNEKTGLPTHNESNSYHPSLEIACLAVLKKSIDVENMTTILDSIKQSKLDVLDFLEKIQKQAQVKNESKDNKSS